MRFDWSAARRPSFAQVWYPRSGPSPVLGIALSLGLSSLVQPDLTAPTKGALAEPGLMFETTTLVDHQSWPFHRRCNGQNLAVQRNGHSPALPAEGEPDDERYSNDGQNDGYERTSAPCRTLTCAGVGVPPARR
jgi:hypothetical protein